MSKPMLQDETAMGFQGVNQPAGQAHRCVGAGQRICTARGAIGARELAASGGFEAICYDLKLRRYFTRAAKAAAAGRKPMVRLHTDKGPFEITADQPVMLQNGEWRAAAELIPGMRLCACTIKPESGYLVRSSDLGKERLDLEHLTEADCAVANWYPVPSVEDLGESDVFKLEVSAGGAQSNTLIWTVGPGGGVGIAIAV